jgi:hypothetical protein
LKRLDKPAFAKATAGKGTKKLYLLAGFVNGWVIFLLYCDFRAGGRFTFV